ncbi:hypothetical protein B0H10DRAFT_903727 [Mycena sp. CBHHK59/15]|nr:hypothetical protein B0H10DRAFT_903727 [Mycena sp. CBHHK59/15]
MASTFTDKNIDPNLLALDPTNDILACIRNNRTTPPVLDPPPALPSGDGDDVDEDAQMPLVSLLPHSSNSNSASSLVAYGHLVKHKITLSDTSSVAFDQFCQTHSADERQVLPLAHILQLLDLSKKNDKGEVWTIPDGLMKKISSYVKAFVFSPTTTSYRGLDVSEHIMQAMCECKVNGLPEEDDLVAVDLVLVRIRDKGTTLRNVYKTKVKESMAKKSPIANIAAVFHKLLKNMSIKPTLQFYQHVALIRWCLFKYPAISDKDFWLKVDEIIAKFRKDSTTDEELNLCLNTIYEDDKAKYGDPSTTDYKPLMSRPFLGGKPPSSNMPRKSSRHQQALHRRSV